MNLPAPCAYYVCIHFFRACTVVPWTSIHCATHPVLQLPQVYFVPFLEPCCSGFFYVWICYFSRLALLHPACDISIMDVSSCTSTSVTVVKRMFSPAFFSKRRNVITSVITSTSKWARPAPWGSLQSWSAMWTGLTYPSDLERRVSFSSVVLRNSCAGEQECRVSQVWTSSLSRLAHCTQPIISPSCTWVFWKMVGWRGGEVKVHDTLESWHLLKQSYIRGGKLFSALKKN